VHFPPAGTSPPMRKLRKLENPRPPFAWVLLVEVPCRFADRRCGLTLTLCMFLHCVRCPSHPDSDGFDKFRLRQSFNDREDARQVRRHVDMLEQNINICPWFPRRQDGGEAAYMVKQKCGIEASQEGKRRWRSGKRECPDVI
jgi:hypothetical protein